MHFLRKAAILICFLAAAGFLFCYAAGNVAPHAGAGESEKNNFSENTGSDKSENSGSGKAENPGISVSEYLENLKSVSEQYGESEYSLTDAVFDENCVITLAVPDDRSFFPQTAKYVSGIVLDDGSTAQESYFTMWPRMGYILLSDGSNREILTSDGKKISVFEDRFLAFASARDSAGTPVFLDCSNGEYVGLLPDGGLVPSDYSPERDFRGVVFDYPSYYGVSDSENCRVNYNGRGFGYFIDGENAHNVPATFDRAFAFSEGFGCAYDSQNRLYFYNTEGRLRIAGLAVIMYGCGEYADERSLGYYYFDEGLTRATKRNYSRGTLVSERQIFIDRKGAEFKTPADYSTYSYSNGRILLEKNGLFGYMTSRGKWICEPDYTYARPFFEGLAVVGDNNGKKGMIDRDGNYVLPQIFDEITDCSGGVICAYDSESGWSIMHKKAAVKPEAETESGADAAALTDAAD